MADGPDGARQRAGALARYGEKPPREFQELWFKLAKRSWRSVVFVPADAAGSAASAACSLAQVGKQLHDLPVTLFVMSNPADYWPALQIVNTASTSDGGGKTPGVPEHGSRPPSAQASSIDYAAAMKALATATSTPAGGRQATGKVIVAIQPVVSEPLGLAVTQAADVVVLCVDLGRTRLDSARRTIELVGRERIGGCLLDSSRRDPRFGKG